MLYFRIFDTFIASQTKYVHTLLYTKMFQPHSCMFRTNQSVHAQGESQFHKSHIIQQYESKIWIYLFKIHQFSC
jgi:hypothetical protein